MYKVCDIDWCKKRSKRGNSKYCSAHYEERRQYGHFLSLEERADRKAINAERCRKQLDNIRGDAEIQNRMKATCRAIGLAKRSVCSVDECENRAIAHGYCPKHYHHVKKYGDAVTGPTRPNRGKGMTISVAGYVQLFMPDHHEANQRGYVMEHRVVMEKVAGRHLRPGEVVHHIDGDRVNNRPDNLELFGSHSEHIKEECRRKRERRLTLARTAMSTPIMDELCPQSTR